MIRTLTLALTLSLTCAAYTQQKPTPAAAQWWSLTTDLSNDAMQGRDTGSEAYERAAKYIADHFKADGLKPAGDNGTYFQRVSMHQVDLDTEHSSVELLTKDGRSEALRLLYETTLAPRADLPALTEGQLVFLGYGVAPTDIDLHGKVAIYFNNTPADLAPEKRAQFTAARLLTLAQAGVAGLISIDNPAAIEPTHWPAAYARSVTLSDARQRPLPNAPLGIRISFEAAPKLFAGSGTDAAKILADALKGLPLPAMELARKVRIQVKTKEKDISSPNIMAVLPGSDPTLASEYVAVSAHLDGYGYGTPVLGDSLYNGALDDAAYVATLIELAHNLANQRTRYRMQSLKAELSNSREEPCRGSWPEEKPIPCNKLPAPALDKATGRSILFCIFTGEEKGLLGSVFYTQHLTVPKESIVADFNLDQLRPIFPLKILTMEGIADSTLGDTAKAVAQTFGIELRPDRETERNLFRRSDNYSFVRIGVPIGSFIFGYNSGTEEERIYRDWYARRYHKPQDDLATPIDWDAAVKFNDFYRALVLKVANDAGRPQWLPGSSYAPKK